jgi:hypothetical protein
MILEFAVLFYFLEGKLHVLLMYLAFFVLHLMRIGNYKSECDRYVIQYLCN